LHDIKLLSKGAYLLFYVDQSLLNQTNNTIPNEEFIKPEEENKKKKKSSRNIKVDNNEE